MIKIICDRCGKEIADGNVGYIATNWRSVEDGSLLGDNPHEGKHFCLSCMNEIEDFVIKTPENVVKTDETVIETPQSVSKEEKSVPKPPETVSESEEQSGRKKIDIGKIMALKNAGWKNKDIADEMRMDPQAVANAIYQYKKRQETGTLKMTRIAEISSERPKL